MNPGPRVLFEIYGAAITDTLIFSWLVVLLLVIGSYIITKKLEMIPRRAQNAVEMLVSALEGQIEPMLPGEGRKFLPFIGTIFIFVGFSNLIGIVPGIVSPSSDLNFPLALALMVFVFSHFHGMKIHGVWPYIKGFAKPIFFLLPLNIIGELAKPISHSFRLFGNIVGGGIILTIVAQFAPWIIPIPLSLWFDIFVGIIQAFIFGMIAIAYISVVKD